MEPRESAPRRSTVCLSVEQNRVQCLDHHTTGEQSNNRNNSRSNSSSVILVQARNTLAGTRRSLI